MFLSLPNNTGTLKKEDFDSVKAKLSVQGKTFTFLFVKSGQNFNYLFGNYVHLPFLINFQHYFYGVRIFVLSA